MSDTFEAELLTLFEKRFDAYRLPFKSANIEISKLDQNDKMVYIEEAIKLLKSNLWKIEIGELYRSLFHSLAFKTITDEERMAYRLCIIVLDCLEKRLMAISKLKNDVELAGRLENNSI